MRQIDKFPNHVIFSDCRLSLHIGRGDWCVIVDWSDDKRFTGNLQKGVIGIVEESML